nr:hypothetical protein [uncultured Draconibacterium sp.]
MKRILGNRIIRIWIVRVAIAFIASQLTGMGFTYCLVGYFVVLFLFDIASRLLLSLIGIVVMIVLALSLFLGLLIIV